MAKEPTRTICPNCLGPAVMEGSEITCEMCDATFTVKRTGGAKVKKLGRLEELEDRVGKLEGLLPGEPGELPAEPQEPDEPAEPDDSDDDIVPR